MKHFGFADNLELMSEFLYKLEVILNYLNRKNIKINGEMKKRNVQLYHKDNHKNMK